ncbi:MAG: SDR family oxidoreductase [Pseudomonadota bacterium]
MPELQCQSFLVVGGAKGIGQATCTRLAAKKAKLLVIDVDARALDDMAEVRQQDVETWCFDMTKRADVTAFCHALTERGVKLDGVVMSAAVHGGCPAEAMSDAFIERIIEVNLTSHVAFVRDLLPSLRDGARIVGISSNCADIGIPMESIYAASKAGIERFYEALAIELSDRRIRPLLIQPGNVNTGFNETGNDYQPTGDGFIDEGYRRVISRIDSSNGIDPGAVADATVHALTARRPSFRTLVGMNALKTHWAKRLLGTDLALRLMAKFFGFRSAH